MAGMSPSTSSHSPRPLGWGGVWQKDDFLGSFIVGNGIGNYSSGGLNTAFPLASNFSIATACATPTATCTGVASASNIIIEQVFAYSANGGYQHWWSPNLRSTIAAGIAEQDVDWHAGRADRGELGEPCAVERFCQPGLEPGRVHHHRR